MTFNKATGQFLYPAVKVTLIFSFSFFFLTLQELFFLCLEGFICACSIFLCAPFGPEVGGRKNVIARTDSEFHIHRISSF